MQALSNASDETLIPFISKARGFNKKAKWLLGIAKELKKDSHIPLNQKDLTALSGICYPYQMRSKTTSSDRSLTPKNGDIV